jgi:hypothetical protein
MTLIGAQVAVEVTANTLPAQASLGAMNERIHETHGAMGMMMGQMASFVGGQIIFAVLARAMMEVEKQIKDVVVQTTQWDDELKKLDTVLASTHSVAGLTRDAAIKLADGLSTVTRFSNSTVLAAEDLLLTFTAIGKDIMPQATEAVLNMTASMGGDVQSRVIQLGKALQDPILGITALKRVGVNFSETQKKMIADWVHHGEVVKAQKFILAELQTEFGGQARAAGETLPGKLAILNNAFDIVKETIGNAMITPITNLITAMIPLARGLAEGLPNALDTAGRFMDGFFGQINKTVSGTRGQMIPAMQDMSKTFSTTLGPAIQQTGGWIMSTLVPAIVQMQVWFATKIMPIILTVAGIIMTDFMPTIEMLAGKILTKLLPPLQRIAADVLPALIPLFRLLGWVFQNVVGPALGFVVDLLGHVLDLIAWVADRLNFLFTHLQQAQQTASAVFHQIHVPGFAVGGVTPGGLVQVGERGPEIVQLPAGSRVYPTGTGPSGGGGSGGQPQPWIITLDGRVLARGLLPPMVQEIRQAAAIRSQ